MGEGEPAVKQEVGHCAETYPFVCYLSSYVENGFLSGMKLRKQLLTYGMVPLCLRAGLYRDSLLTCKRLAENKWETPESLLFVKRTMSELREPVVM